MNKVLRVIFDVNMGGQHRSLAHVASRFKINVNNLKEGEHIMFINKKRDKAKLYSGGQVLSYLNDGRLTEDSLNKFCRVYGAKDLEFDHMMLKILRKHLFMFEKTSSQKTAFDAASLSA